MYVLSFIYRNLGRYRRLFWVVLVCGLVNSFATFMIPVLLAEFTKHGINPAAASQLIASIAGLYILALVVSYVIRGRGEALANQFANRLRLDYFRQLERLPLPALTSKHSGFSLSLITKVAESSTQVLFSLFWELIPGFMSAVLFFVFMARESVPLAAVNAIIFGAFVGVSILLSRRMVPLSAALNRTQAGLVERFVDFMGSILTVKKLGIATFATNALQDRVEATDQQVTRVQTFHARRWFLLHSLFGLSYIATLGFLVWQIGQGQLSAALLILFVSAYGTIRSLIERLSENIKLIMEMRAYLQDLDAIIGQQPTEKHHNPPKTWQRITFKGVAFQHAGGGAEVNIPYFDLRVGEKTCIEGKSGQGKSTFLNLITNLLQPTRGERLVDNMPYNTLGGMFFVHNVAVISQETELFNMSIRENLTLGRRIPDAKLVGLLTEVDLNQWLGELEHGLDTVVGEKGLRLSAGQKQRLNIVRGVLLDRSLYILDEPTSHLDAHVEEVVVTFLQKHLQNRAAIIVTHRPALKKICSSAYVMEAHTLHLRTEASA